MEEELNKVLDTAPEIEDMPDFGEEETTTDAETQETTETAPAEEKPKTEDKGEKKEETKKEDKPNKETFKSNLPTGFSFNPLVMNIKPFYEKLIAEDDIFARIVKERESRAEKPKSISECADYILSEVYNYVKDNKFNSSFGFAGFPDEDMIRLIRHYYDEEFLEVQKMTGAKAVVATSKSPAPPKSDKKADKKKGNEKPKDKPKAEKNVFDITKAIKSNTASTDDGKKKKDKKKDNLLAGFVPMERPNSYAEGKKGSRQQAKSVEQMDLFAGFFGD